jgi:hypothetical protein
MAGEEGWTAGEGNSGEAMVMDVLEETHEQER